MKKRIILPLILTIGLLALFMTACKKENQSETYSVSGKVQKGPFVTGAIITINELNSDLEQTGKSFTSSISADDGSFSLNSVELVSEIALITVNGYYYDEHLNIVQNGVLNLQALVDISGKTIINVNALTHVLKDRIEILYKSGNSFQNAYKQAQNELIESLFGISDANLNDFDQLDISASGSDNALLIAFSAMMLRRTAGDNDVSTLTELLTNIRTDFKDDGEINNTTLKNKIWNNVRLLNPVHIKNNLTNKYQQMGINVILSDFQFYLNKFVEKHAPIIYSDFQYPQTSVLASHFYEDNVALDNLLDKTLSSFNLSQGVAVAAITPLDKIVKIKMTPVNQQDSFLILNEGFIRYDFESGGWLIEKIEPQEFVILTQRQNMLVSMKFPQILGVNSPPFPIFIEYFEDGATTPTFTKTVTFIL
jgi:hypothetical protein